MLFNFPCMHSCRFLKHARVFKQIAGYPILGGQNGPKGAGTVLKVTRMNFMIENSPKLWICLFIETNNKC